MSTSTAHDIHERRPAIWPWIAMPLIVLMVFYTLQRFQHSAKTAAAPSSQGDSASDASGTAEP